MDVIATTMAVVVLVVILGVIAEGTIIIRFCPLLFEREERKSTHYAPISRLLPTIEI